MSKDKSAGQNGGVDRKGQIFFIDVRKQASGRISRTQVEFTDADMQRIAQAYPRWRGTELADEAGFCYSATQAEVEKHGFVLTPGRHVGAVAEDDDDEAFGEKMERLTAQLAEQMAKGVELDAKIAASLGVPGYPVLK